MTDDNLHSSLNKISPSQPINDEYSKINNKKIKENDQNSNRNLNEEKENSSPLCSKEAKAIIQAGLIGLIFLIIVIALSASLVKKEDEKVEEKVNILIDADADGDDMVAYSIAKLSNKFNILGLTLVSPEGLITKTEEYWLKFLTFMNFNNAEVYLGQNAALQRTDLTGVWNKNYGITFPTSDLTSKSTDAVTFMVNSLKSNKNVIVFLLGPMTNFAKAIQQDNTILNNIDKIIIMGGCKDSGCNAGSTTKAENNIYEDSDAANYVFTNCNKPIYMIGTDVSTKLNFDDTIYKNILKSDNKLSTVIYEILQNDNDNLIDFAAIIYYLNGNIFTFTDYYVTVNHDLNNDNTVSSNYGVMTFNTPSSSNPANVKYCTNVNKDKFFEFLYDFIKKH